MSESVFSVPANDFADEGEPTDPFRIARAALERLLRFQLPYTRIGARCLLAVRPPHSAADAPRRLVPRANKASAQNAAAGFKDSADAVSKDRAAQLRSLCSGANLSHSDPPHVVDVAAAAFVHLVNDRQDQTIVLAGVSGSGKSESARNIARHLCDLSRPTLDSKKSRIHSAALKIDHVLSAFGCAATAENQSASRFCRFTEYQFDAAGAMAGIKLMAYCLEKHRVSDAADSHANFDVFYFFLAGADSAARTKWALAEPSHFAFLSHVGARQSVLSPQHHFNPDALPRLCDSMKAVGVPSKSHSDIFQLLSAILHLGNISFVRPSEAASQQPCEIKNPQQLEIAASLLGVSFDHLRSALTMETRAVGSGDLCTLILDMDGAVRQRNNLAQLLYSLLFFWIIELINKKLCKDESEFSNSISVVDFHGILASSPASRSVSRLIANYALERVHAATMKQIARINDEIVASGDLSSSDAASPSTMTSQSDSLLSLLAAPTTGIIDMICHEAYRRTNKSAAMAVAAASSTKSRPPLPSSSSVSSILLDRLVRIHSDNPNFVVHQPNRKCFGIYHHVSGGNSVQYDVNLIDASVVDEGTTNIPTDFVSLFCGSMDQPATRFSFIRNLFSKRSIDVDVHPKHHQTLLRARQSTLLARRPSTLRRRPPARSTLVADQASRPDTPVDPDSSIMRHSIVDGPAFDTNSLLSQTRTSMDELAESLEYTNVWTVIHIRLFQPPNKSGSGTSNNNSANLAEIVRQIKSFHVDVLANMVGAKYAVGIPMNDFLNRVLDVLMVATKFAHVNDLRDAPDRVCEAVGDMMALLGLDPNQYLATAGRVFLTEMGARKLYTKINNGRLLLGLSLSNQSNKSSETLSNKENENDSQVDGGIDVYDQQVISKLVTNASNSDRFKNTKKSASRLFGVPRMAGQRRSVNSIVASSTSSHMGDDEPVDVASMYDFTAAPANNVDNRSSRRKDVEYGNVRHETAPQLKPMPRSGMNSSNVQKTSKAPIPLQPKPVSRARRSWMCVTWALTWWIPTPIISCMFRKRTRDVQIAWREKVALCVIIFFMCAAMLFLIVGLGRILCPSQQVMSEGEISTHNTLDNPMVLAFGSYYLIKDVVQTHVMGSSPFVGVAGFTSTVLGRDVTAMFFPTLLPQKYCPGFSLPPGWDNVYQRANQGTPNVWYQHRNDPSHPNTFTDYLNKMQYMRRGAVARDSEWISSFMDSDAGHRIIIAWGNVYDISSYYDSSNVGATGNSSGFFGDNVKQVFDAYADAKLRGRDATTTLNQLQNPVYGGPQFYKAFRMCMDGMFLTGVVDTRNALRCTLPNYILLAASCILVAVIGVKFVGALQYGNSRVVPEDQDRFVICQVPCYTEDETSIRKTLDSLARTSYNDTRKLLFVVCDGMIIGAGNDRPTPRIVLDVLGVDPLAVEDPEPLSFQSLGTGSRQHNMGKVYSGLYDVEGHRVPFIVVIKTGAPSERVKPGNRGKRDSQLVLMRFLHHVHFNAPMSPLELEMYRQMKYVIGVHPSMYEYVLMVDADTEVMPDSLTHMIATMVSDARIMGLCGETQLANEQSSWVTMIQVYEYFISHHLAKAFESLFGTVTCLPGCFCMYRVRSSNARATPLLIAPSVLNDYTENNVNTLHLKNLLELGEDRYLTTLMLKHFPQMRTAFVPQAVCRTGAPDTWSVLLSQRRRWINSTVHNLFELVFLKQLCGFCCFSMRFVVFLDLFATFLQPASVLYVVYLIAIAIASSVLPNDGMGNIFIPANATVFPMISLILIASIYGLQAIIFLIKQEWQHVGWMLIYLMAMPVFGVFVPLYAFWHFDDFSWGNTRIVAGAQDHDHGKPEGQGDEFDPAEIPLAKWDEVDPGGADGYAGFLARTGQGWPGSLPQNVSVSAVMHQNTTRPVQENANDDDDDVVIGAHFPERIVRNHSTRRRLSVLGHLAVTIPQDAHVYMPMETLSSPAQPSTQSEHPTTAVPTAYEQVYPPPPAVTSQHQRKQ